MSDSDASDDLETRMKQLDEREKKLKDMEEKMRRKEREGVKRRQEKERKKEEHKEKMLSMQKEVNEMVAAVKQKQKEMEEVIEEETSGTEVEEVEYEEETERNNKKKNKRKKRKKSSSSSDEGRESKRRVAVTKMKVPTLEEGTTYNKYRMNVEMWVAGVRHTMNEEDMAMNLLQALPDKDNRGGLKGQIWKKHGEKGLRNRRGVEIFLDFMDRKMKKADFVRCIELNDRHMAIKQKQGWNIDKYIAEAQTSGIRFQSLAILFQNR